MGSQTFSSAIINNLVNELMIILNFWFIFNHLVLIKQPELKICSPFN